MKSKLYAVVVVFAGLMTTGSTFAQAQCSGFITQIASVVTGNCDLDRLHDAVGDPLNQLNPFQQPSPGPFAPTGPSFAPAPAFAPTGFFPPQVAFGARCMTNVGVSGYGPLNPVGSFCTWSPAPGVVIPGTVIQ